MNEEKSTRVYEPKYMLWKRINDTFDDDNKKTERKKERKKK